MQHNVHVYIPLPTNTKLHKNYKTTEEFTLYSYRKKKTGSNVFPGQSVGRITPTMVNPAMKTLEKSYRRLWISVIHFPYAAKKKVLNRIEEWRI